MWWPFLGHFVWPFRFRSSQVHLVLYTFRLFAAEFRVFALSVLHFYFVRLVAFIFKFFVARDVALGARVVPSGRGPCRVGIGGGGHYMVERRRRRVDGCHHMPWGGGVDAPLSLAALHPHLLI